MKSCLIVEDSDLIREIAVRLISDLGLETHEASNVEEALDRYGAVEPDVVLLDWDLPLFGALDVLRGVAGATGESRPNIVLCATENDPQQFTLARAAGASKYLLKPFDRESIASVFIELGVLDDAAAHNRAVS